MQYPGNPLNIDDQVFIYRNIIFLNFENVINEGMIENAHKSSELDFHCNVYNFTKHDLFMNIGFWILL